MVIEAVDFDGGISVMWNSDAVELELVAGNAQVMTIFVKQVDEAPWTLSAVYASPNCWYREELWSYLIHVGEVMTLPWMVLGDFNQVLCASDKKGGRLVFPSQTMSFLYMVRTCGLVDLGFTRSKYTWSNMQQGIANVQKHLDMAFENALCVQKLTSYRVVHIPRSWSDHNPIMVHDISDTNRMQYPKPFKVQAAWFQHPSFE